MDKGYIKIHRKIQESWIFEKPEYFKAWITILLQVNHTEKKTIIDGDLITVKRGQACKSLKTWVKLLGKGWTVQKVRTLFNSLVKDEKINTQGLRKTTLLTVCNYDTYQSNQHGDNTQNDEQPTHSQHTANTQITTNNELKNERIKELKKYIKEKINELFRRRDTTEWSDKEKKELNKIANRADCIQECDLIVKLYNSEFKFKRKNVVTLLNNWNGELDHALNPENYNNPNQTPTGNVQNETEPKKDPYEAIRRKQQIQIDADRASGRGF
jgi:hypothetical protein